MVAWDAPGAGGSSDPPESFGLADGDRRVDPGRAAGRGARGPLEAPEAFNRAVRSFLHDRAR